MFCAMINMNEYWNASPLRPKSGSNTLLHCVFSFLRPKSKDTCKDGDSDAYKCVYVIIQSRQKRKGAHLSHRKRRRTHIGLLFDIQCLKIGCFKTAVLKNAQPCCRCSHSFSNELVILHLLRSPVHTPWAEYKDRSHSNDEKVLPETMYFATPRYKR